MGVNILQNRRRMITMYCNPTINKFEVGTIDGSSGQNVDNTTRARLVWYIPIESFVSCNVVSGYQYFAFLYEMDKSFHVRIPSSWSDAPLARDDITDDYPDAKYIRILIRRSNGATITGEDLNTAKTFIKIR